MAYTHRVLRPWTGVRAGQLVDADTDPAKWRNAAKLIASGWLRPLTIEEQRLVADGYLPPGSVTGPNDPPLQALPPKPATAKAPAAPSAETPAAAPPAQALTPPVDDTAGRAKAQRRSLPD